MTVSPQISALILPGLGNSGPEHWQSRWQAANPRLRRVELGNWDAPTRSNWVSLLEAAVAAAGPQVVLVAHSLACSLVGHWAAQSSSRVKAALLVAPADVERPDFPSEAASFAPMPLQALPFPSIVIASQDDPYVKHARAAYFARAWGSRLVDIGRAGHINAASGLGDWPVGRQLLQELLN